MTVKLTKVEGGFQLVIPDELAAQAGFEDGAQVEVEVSAEVILIRQPEFVAAARDALYARITPDTLPDPDDDSAEYLEREPTYHSEHAPG